MTLPIPCAWNGEAFVPRRGFAARCDAELVVGETYRLQIVQERSAASHRHFFSAINEAWASLPEHKTDQFPTPEALRKWALIRAGYCDTRQIVASSKAEAVRLAAFVAPMDSHAVVTVRDAVVTVYTAHSQSVRAMDKAVFQESKDKVLAIIAEQIGVTPEELSAARAA